MDFSTFDDLVLYSDEEIKLILRNVDAKVLAKVLTASSEDIQNKIFKNLSEVALKEIKDDMNYMGPASPMDELVLEFKGEIIDIINELFPGPLIDDAGPDEWA